MASGTVSAAIEAYLAANWTATPLAFENKNQFENGNPIPPADEIAWVEMELTGTRYGQVSIGAITQAGNRWDEEGMLLLNVLVPGGTGSATARTHAKSLADLFRGVTLLSGQLEFMDAFIGKGEPSQREGNWYQIPVDIEWRRVEG